MLFYGEPIPEELKENHSFFRVNDNYYNITDFQDIKTVIVGLYSYFFFKTVSQKIEIVKLKYLLQLEKERNKDNNIS